ncbi:phospholipase D family nuclease [Budvicia aquatica]|uniref:phospholipase D family nuclease n=1 Tax=Budvicia aquatica TaxID=82979 RepID=UPI00208AC9A6|nr:phospholipase D family protein [Budvicia aquatica]GKX52226.1 endonuclease [Budvicia aquatica]
MKNFASVAAFYVFILCSPAGAADGVPVNSNAPQIQVGFSPEGTARELVLNVIGSAKQQILLMGYSFTSPEIVKALISAKNRNVDVRIVLDKKANVGRANETAIRLILNANIDVRLSEGYQAQHDKVIIVDARHIQTGSYNYSAAAAKYNSENVIVLWNSPELAKSYITHWKSRWDKGE